MAISSLFNDYTTYVISWPMSRCKTDSYTAHRFTIRIKARTKFSRIQVNLRCHEELLAVRRNRRRPSYSRRAISQVPPTSSFVESSGRATFSLAKPTTSGGRSRGQNQQAYLSRHGKTGSVSVG